MNTIRISILPALTLMGMIYICPLRAQTSAVRPEIKKSTDGVPYLSTGIGYDSRVGTPEFSLKLIFSTKNKAYLADIDVEITPGPSGKPTLIHSTGPWLLVDLAPGKYRVKAKTGKGHETVRTFAIAKGQVTTLRLIWDITDEDI